MIRSFSSSPTKRFVSCTKHWPKRRTSTASTPISAERLTIEFDDPPAKFVVSPNAPVKQVWVSAHMKSYKLDWDPARSEFVLPESGQSLKQLVEEAVASQLGERSRCNGRSLHLVSVLLSEVLVLQLRLRGVLARVRRPSTREALLREIRSHAWQWTPDTVYFGGGTPSNMDLGVLEACARRQFRDCPGVRQRSRPRRERSLVRRPKLGGGSGSIGSAWSAVLRRRGVGADGPPAYGRDRRAAIASTLRSAGITDLNIDLIAGLPHQTPKSGTNRSTGSSGSIRRTCPFTCLRVDEDSRLGLEILNNGPRYDAAAAPDR